MASSLVVFTRDLRVADNPALSTACARSAAVLPLFVFDEPIVARSAGHVNRLRFLLQALADLDASLRALGGALAVRRGDWVAQVLAAASAAAASDIHVSEDVSGYAAARLARLDREAARLRLRVVRHPGITIVPPGAITPPGGRAYRVFTPYFRRWQQVTLRRQAAIPQAVPLPPGVDAGHLPDLAELTLRPAARPAAGALTGGERHGQARLRAWLSGDLSGYDRHRDDLAAGQTSRLSAYLHLGCLSPLQVAASACGNPGADAFVRQLAWRDFFCQLLAAYPGAARHDFRDRGDRWTDDPDALAAWQSGRTGYPVVDAGMRQLAAEGFLPNRARMIVASFLAKDLYLDWRLGAAHFLRHLADGDLAVNQMNWQWVAGTGTDTSRHRVLSPARQGRKFDPAGDYIRRYVPELGALPAGLIHDPDPRTRRACGYPDPLVDHRAAVAAYHGRKR